MLTILTLPGNFVATTTAYIGELFTDLNAIIAVVIGLPLGFWVVKKIIYLFRVQSDKAIDKNYENQLTKPNWTFPNIKDKK